MIDYEAHRHAVEQVVPDMFEAMAQDLPQTNLAASNQCEMLTKGLYIALTNQGFDIKREYHEDNDGIFHYVINHQPEAEAPREEDVITDLNPWQFMTDHLPSRVTHTYLHGTRQEVMERLEKEGAPDYFIALRGLATVTKAHTFVTKDSKPRTLYVA